MSLAAPGRMSARGWVLAGCLCLVAAGPTPQQVQDAERARAALLEQQRSAQSRAAVLAQQEQALAASRIAAAARLRALEEQTAAAADRVADLARRQDESRVALRTSMADLERFLPVIERLALYPAETLLAVPEPPERSVRGVLVLRGLMRQIEQDAASVRAEQATLAGLQAELDRARPELAQRLAAQTVQEADLDAQLAATSAGRKAAEAAAGDAARRAAAEAARANSLRAAIAQLEAARQEAARLEADRTTHRPDPAGPPEAPVFGTTSLLAPVAGRVIRNFGDPVDGDSSTSLGFQVPPAARVVSPCGGRVVFAGPFRSYGLLLIVDCGHAWHAVLSGFSRLDASLGQAVQIGEPIGVMPAYDPQSQQAHPVLSMELRHDSQPVNPAPYLRSRG
jgi:septal ring factor EnvC (AmiA/AmiB activator)